MSVTGGGFPTRDLTGVVERPTDARLSMIDQSLRPAKDRVLGAIARPMARRLPALWITLLSLVACSGAGLAAWRGLRWLSVGLWLGGRVLDGLDGLVARTRGEQSDLGGYFDMMADTIGYAAVPIGLAAGQGRAAAWAWCAVLLATFYVNTMSWTYLSAIAEKRAAGAAARGERASVHMPAGLIEGAETIVLFAVMLAWPDRAVAWFVVMAVLVVVTAGQRVRWAYRHL